MWTLFDEEKIMRNYIRSEREEAAKAAAAEAAVKSAVEMCQDFKVSFSDAVQKLIAKFGLSEADAEEAVQRYWQ